MAIASHTTIPRERIEEILKAGVQAPSGSNSQPWRFEVAKGAVSVFMLPEKDHPILNYKNRGTIFSTGCLIENIAVAAEHYGLAMQAELFPDAGDPNLAARVSFSEGRSGGGDARLFDAIWKRATNRKPFETKKLNALSAQAALAAPAAAGAPEVVVRLTEDPKQMEMLAEAASVNEVLLFGNRHFHKLFFDEIVWDEKEEHEKKSGLYLKTMELKPPQVAALKVLFRQWPVMRLLAALGVPRGIAKGNAKGYAACAAYGGVICGPSDKDFLDTGRVIERIWLQAAASGLSFHLQTGTNFMHQRLLAEGIPDLSARHGKLIRKAYAEMAGIFKVPEGKLLPAIFRIGYDGEPSGRSSRKAPDVSFT